MKSIAPLALLAAVLAPGMPAQAQPLPLAVVIEYSLGKQLPEEAEQTLIAPVERALVAMPQLLELHSSVTNGWAHVELDFARDATEGDVEAVAAQIDRYTPRVAAPRTIRLGEPRLARGLSYPFKHPQEQAEARD